MLAITAASTGFACCMAPRMVESFAMASSWYQVVAKLSDADTGVQDAVGKALSEEAHKKDRRQREFARWFVLSAESMAVNF